MRLTAAGLAHEYYPVLGRLGKLKRNSESLLKVLALVGREVHPLPVEVLEGHRALQFRQPAVRLKAAALLARRFLLRAAAGNDPAEVRIARGQARVHEPGSLAKGAG